MVKNSVHLTKCVVQPAHFRWLISRALDDETKAPHHITRSSIVDLQLALKVFGRDASLRRTDQMNCEEPFVEW